MGAADLTGLLSPAVSGGRAGPNPWGITEAILGFAAGLVVSAVAASAMAAAVGDHRGGGAPIPVAVLVADLVGLWVGLAGAAVLASRKRGSGSLARDLGLRIGGWLDVVGGAAVGVACQLLLVPGLYLPFEQLDHGLAHRLSVPAHQETGAAHGLVAIAVVIAFVGVGAPIVEEVFFRGLLLRGLLGRLPVPLAVLVAALAFALAHFEALQFAGLAAFGLVLGALAWATGRLAPGIAAHAAFNLTAVLTVVHLHG